MIAYSQMLPTSILRIYNSASSASHKAGLQLGSPSKLEIKKKMDFCRHDKIKHVT